MKTWRPREKEGHMKTAAEIRATLAQAKEHLRLPELGETRKGPRLEASDGGDPGNTLIWGFQPPELWDKLPLS